MIALFSQKCVPTKCKVVLERRMQTAPGERTERAQSLATAKRVFEGVRVPGPRPTARFPRGVRGLGFFLCFVRVRSNFRGMQLGACL